jgi:microcystin-dependent protein
MAEPFIGEVRLFGFGFAPKNWALCNGQVMAINQNQALFSLLMTTYGGNGSTTFGLPNLQGRAPVHVGPGFNQGQSGGEAVHVLTTSEVPSHNHQAFATTTPASTSTPSPSVMLAQSTAANLYAPATSTAPMAANAVASVGGSLSHENQQPYLAINFCIALTGIFPSRN